MIQTLLIGAAIGGVAAFVWGAISWMLLPWHHSTFHSFRDEDEVVRVLADNAPRSGIYGLPAPPKTESGMSSEERKAADAAVWERMKKGPLVMAVIQSEGFTPIWLLVIRALVIYMLASLILTWLLLQTTGLSFLGKACFIGLAALAAGVICRLTDWNWHGYSTSYTLVTVADTFIGWSLTGLAIAAVVKP